MGELRQIPFDTILDTNNKIESMLYGEQLSPDKHWTNVTYKDQSFIVSCSCGQCWTGWSTDQDFMQQKIKETFNSHLCYFDRPKTKVD